MKKLAVSVLRIPFGLLIILFGAIFIFANEYNYSQFEKNYGELRKNYHDISNDEINPKNNGKLVVVNGEINVKDEYIMDPFTNIKVKANKLTRVVEMYQYSESHSSIDGHDGYTYNGIWSETLINSESFANDSYHNPTHFNIESEVFYPEEAYLGIFKINNEELSKLNRGKQLKVFNNPELPKGYHLVSDFTISNAVDPNKPKIGDIRITYYYNDSTFITLLGKQENDRIVPYQTKKGVIYDEVFEDYLLGRDVLSKLANNNTEEVWLHRLIGTLINIVGFATLLAFNPILSFFSGIIFKGNQLYVSILFGILFSLAGIAGIYFSYRPLVGIILVASIILIMILYYLVGKLMEGMNNK